MLTFILLYEYKAEKFTSPESDKTSADLFSSGAGYSHFRW